MFKFMSWQPTLFTLFGIPLIVHSSTFIFLLSILLFGGLKPFALITLALASIIPHEYGHALAARYYGIKCRRILMLPIGGLALLENLPRDWKKEAVIVAAGPLVTLAIVLMAFPLAFLLQDVVLMVLAIINSFIFVFNVLPVFPMDGGRLLRAILHTSLSYEDATYYAVRTGQCFAVVLGCFMVLSLNIMGVVTMALMGVMAEVELRSVKGPTIL